MRGRRPTATSSSSPRSSSPPSSRQRDLPALAARGADRLRPGAHLDAAGLEPRGDLLARERLLGGDQPVRRLDQGDAGAEAAPGLGELHPDHPAAEDQQPPGHGLRRRRLAVGPRGHLREAVDRRDRRGRPGRDHDRLARRQALVAHDHCALAVERGAAAQELDPAVVEPRDHAAVVEVVDDLVAAGEHELRVELAVDELAHARHALGLVEELAGTQQRLRGHAGVERALAADQLLLDDRGLQARRPPRAQPRPRPPGPRRSRSRRTPWRS